MTEKEKMLAGALYNANDAELVAARVHTRGILLRLNACPPNDETRRRALTAELLGGGSVGGSTGSDAFLQAPFFCDYGTHITLGKGFYCNFNCVILDVAPVRIGDNVLFGPAVQVYTATHPLNADARRKGLESGSPVTIGDDVWVGGGAILCPGVTIGDRSVIGAGSVVTKDIPEDSLAAGNPCRVIRSLKPSESP